MALKKTINETLEPAGNLTLMRGKSARDYQFRAGGQTHASVRIHEGFRAASKPMEEEPGAGKGFTPLRLVVNLLIKDKSNRAATRFSEPFELRIRYTSEDTSGAGGRDKLKLAYWNNQEWVVLKSSEHKFKVEDDEFLFAELSSWPSDPPIAVGH